MPIIFSTPPVASVRELETNIFELARLGEQGPRSFRAAAPDDIEPTAPHKVFDISLNDLLQGHGLDNPRLVAWRYLVTRQNDVIAAAEVDCDEPQVKHAFGLLNEGPYVTATSKALRIGEEQKVLEGVSLEFTVIRIPALYVMAVWLRDEKGMDDVIIPMPPTHSLLEPWKHYTKSEFGDILSQAARDRGSFDDSPKLHHLDSIDRTFYILRNEKVAAALEEFHSLDPTSMQSADRLFETYGPGNIIERMNSPVERFLDYESLLALLQRKDADKYRLLHKGTPFYFLFWTAFDARNYEKSVFYLDSAVSEDMRCDPDNWIERPASKLLMLHDELQVAQRVKAQILGSLQFEFDRFNAVSGLKPITVENWREFVKRLLKADFSGDASHSKRSIVSTFYTFLLEFSDRNTELVLRSGPGGSVEPFLAHLFKGGVLFESLLKFHYPKQDSGRTTDILRHAFENSDFKNEFLEFVDQKAYSLREIAKNIADSSNPDDLQTAFKVTAQLRNTTGHNLVWDDIFTGPEAYTAFFHQQVNALLYVLAIKDLNLRT
jgi:hypothetical protein